MNDIKSSKTADVSAEVPNIEKIEKTTLVSIIASLEVLKDISVDLMNFTNHVFSEVSNIPIQKIDPEDISGDNYLDKMKNLINYISCQINNTGESIVSIRNFLLP